MASKLIEMLNDGTTGFRTYFTSAPIGMPIGSKRGMVVKACLKCGKPSWRKSRTEFVHETVTRLQPNNQPDVQVMSSCEITKSEADYQEALEEKEARAKQVR